MIEEVICLIEVRLNFAVQRKIYRIQKGGFTEGVVPQDEGDVLLLSGSEVEGMFTAKLPKVLNGQFL
jgi:hypothetical protein